MLPHNLNLLKKEAKALKAALTPLNDVKLNLSQARDLIAKTFDEPAWNELFKSHKNELTLDLPDWYEANSFKQKLVNTKGRERKLHVLLIELGVGDVDSKKIARDVVFISLALDPVDKAANITFEKHTRQKVPLNGISDSRWSEHVAVIGKNKGAHNAFVANIVLPQMAKSGGVLFATRKELPFIGNALSELGVHTPALLNLSSVTTEDDLNIVVDPMALLSGEHYFEKTLLSIKGKDKDVFTSLKGTVCDAFFRASSCTAVLKIASDNNLCLMDEVPSLDSLEQFIEKGDGSRSSLMVIQTLLNSLAPTRKDKKEQLSHYFLGARQLLSFSSIGEGEGLDGFFGINEQKITVICIPDFSDDQECSLFRNMYRALLELFEMAMTNQRYLKSFGKSTFLWIMPWASEQYRGLPTPELLLSRDSKCGIVMHLAAENSHYPEHSSIGHSFAKEAQTIISLDADRIMITESRSAEIRESQILTLSFDLELDCAYFEGLPWSQPRRVSESELCKALDFLVALESSPEHRDNKKKSHNACKTISAFAEQSADDVKGLNTFRQKLVNGRYNHTVARSVVSSYLNICWSGINGWVH
jgi:hypothetical protein